MSDKIVFKLIVARDKGPKYIMTTGLIHAEDRAIVSIYTPHTGVTIDSKY